MANTLEQVVEKMHVRMAAWFGNAMRCILVEIIVMKLLAQAIIGGDDPVAFMHRAQKFKAIDEHHDLMSLAIGRASRVNPGFLVGVRCVVVAAGR